MLLQAKLTSCTDFKIEQNKKTSDVGFKVDNKEKEGGVSE